VGGCDASSQNVDATPSSRETNDAPFGWAMDSGDEASPTPSATGASQLRVSLIRPSTASFRLIQYARTNTAAVGVEVTRLISILDWRLRFADFQNEAPYVVSYGIWNG